ncbi:MAG TPA: response regulator [Candidatus Sulfotelmatobacter sp.]|nr:response regulator [Candidatus Sulfotelmatobacter sp.]
MNAARRRREVLVIDDDPHVVAMVSAILSPDRFQVSGAEAGDAGIALATARAPDLILLDLEMPGKTGYQVCHLLKQDAATRRIPIVMLTASDDPALNRTAYAAGAAACILKPFRRDAVIGVIEAALGS